ncbi:acyltransferase family protein, partial [Klebsiella pneumoniae]|nr:acyltransferase family protein [Klebsiella pneumoniae]
MRETWVDYAKGIGIILVVFGHANRGLYSSGIYISPEIYHYLDNVIYSFHMPLFFFLSGLFFVRESANKQVISSQADSLIKISRIWADFFPA